MVIQLEQQTASRAPGTRLSSWWTIVTIGLVLVLFTQAVFAGAMLSGFNWARQAHAANALFVVVATFNAGLTSIVMLRGKRNGLKLCFLLLGLAAAAFVQSALGRLAAKGVNLMWVHVPLGVMLLGLAWQAAAIARQLGDEG